MLITACNPTLWPIRAFRLSGIMPFLGNDQAETFELVKAGKFTFPTADFKVHIRTSCQQQPVSGGSPPSKRARP